MSITKESELIGMQQASEAVAYTLREMIKYAQPWMTTKEPDHYVAKIFSDFGVKSVLRLTYGFPGKYSYTQISLNQINVRHVVLDFNSAFHEITCFFGKFATWQNSLT